MPHKNWAKETRERLQARDGDDCFYCGNPMRFPNGESLRDHHPLFATVEHLLPKWRGGGDEDDNLVLAHLNCNHSQNAMDRQLHVPGSKAKRQADHHVKKWGDDALSFEAVADICRPTSAPISTTTGDNK